MGPGNKKPAARSWLREAGICGLIFAIPVVTFSFILALAHVDGNSMNPGLVNGDTVVCLRHAQLQRGDVFLFKASDGRVLVKRAVGLPGDAVSVTDGHACVNGALLDEGYSTTANGAGPDFESLTVPEGCVFALGDNRGASLDSRDASIGFIDNSDIIGKLVLRLGTGGGS